MNFGVWLDFEFVMVFFVDNDKFVYKNLLIRVLVIMGLGFVYVGFNKVEFLDFLLFIIIDMI